MLQITHVQNDVEPEIGHVHDRLFVLRSHLSMMYQTVQVVIGQAILADDVESDDAEFVEVLQCLVQEDRGDVAHVVLDLFALCVCAHGQILKIKDSVYFFCNSETGISSHTCSTLHSLSTFPW